MWACALFSSLRCCVSNSALLLTVAMRCEMMVSYSCRASQFSTYCCVNECGEFRDDAVPTRTPAVASLGGAPLGTASAAFRDLKVKRLFRESNDGHGLTVPSCTIVKSWNEDSVHAEVNVGWPLRICGGAGAGSTPRTFAWKVRRKTDMGYGSLRTKDPIALEEKRQKVCVFFSQ